MHDIDYRGIFQSRGCRMPSHLAVCGTYEGQWWGCWKTVERIVSELWFQLSWVKFAYLKRRDCVERILLLCFFSLLVFFLERIMQQVVAFFFFLMKVFCYSLKGAYRSLCVLGITYVFDSIIEITWFYALAENCSLWSFLHEEMSSFVRGVSMKAKSCLLRICLLDFCILKLFHLFISGYQLPGLLCQARRSWVNTTGQHLASPEDSAKKGGIN